MWNNPETEEKETWHICTDVASLISVIKKGHRLVQKKECLLLFPREWDTPFINSHYLSVYSFGKKVEEHFFLTKNVRKKMCFPFKGGNFGKYGFEWLSFSSDNKYSAYVSTCKAALVNI